MSETYVLESYEKVIPWSIDFKIERSITFDGIQFQNYIDTAVPETTKLPLIQPFSSEKLVAEGHNFGNNLYGCRRILPFRATNFTSLGFFGPPIEQKDRRQSLALFMGKKRGNAFFSTPITIPLIGLNRSNMHCGHAVVMSLTPMEIATCRPGLRFAKGKVAIAGLGLGWMARRVLERKQVKHLTIIEQNPAIIDFFGKPIKEQFGDKVDFICGDAWKQNYDPYDVMLWDIWNGYPDAKWDDKFQKFKYEQAEKGKKVWGWGDVEVSSTDSW